MRKQTKLVAVLSATALLAIGASAAAFAAGWDNSTGEWQWLDNDGVAVSNEWKKSGNDWFYLGDDGIMATSMVIDDDGDYYYVNETGAMVSNTWVSVANEDGSEDAEYRWYYFGANGKAYTGSSDKITASSMKTINGKRYAFDSEGKMLYGWVSETNPSINEDETAWETSEYYFGDWNDGAAKTGWQQLSVVDSDGDDHNYWFWFNSNGKKTVDEKKTIDGKTYKFNTEHGYMLDDWANATNSAITSTSSVVYLNGDGAMRKKTWVWAIPAEDYIRSDYEDENASWWYADANGEVVKNEVKKINGKYYAFDSMGRMKTKLVLTDANNENIVTKNGDTTYTDMEGDAFAKLGLDITKDNDNDTDYSNLYYFSDTTDDGSRKGGYQNVEFDDDVYQMYFNTSTGKAETGYVSKINKFTANGVVLKANNNDSNYAGVVAVYNTENSKYEMNGYNGLKYGTATKDTYLINTAGTLQKNKKNLKDVNDIYYVTDKYGKVLYAGDVKAKEVSDGVWEADK